MESKITFFGHAEFTYNSWVSLLVCSLGLSTKLVVCHCGCQWAEGQMFCEAKESQVKYLIENAFGENTLDNLKEQLLKFYFS